LFFGFFPLDCLRFVFGFFSNGEAAPRRVFGAAASPFLFHLLFLLVANRFRSSFLRRFFFRDSCSLHPSFYAGPSFTAPGSLSDNLAPVFFFQALFFLKRPAFFVRCHGPFRLELPFNRSFFLVAPHRLRIDVSSSSPPL